MTPITSSPDQAQRGTDERDHTLSHFEFVSLDQMSGAWLAVVEVLNEACPGWTNQIGTGKQNAIDAIKKLRADAEQLRARDEEIAALRKDAERLDWLGRGYKTCSVSMDGTSRFSPTNAVYNMRGETFRDAIDNAALQEKSRDAG